ncbi:aldose 1-epimerase [Decorospora gaudefroyi]|uniref:Aldose 1-epimerase n=1 Tax=Decorospora gaudefroyi TaxID=184978 RepID=A0A6A5KDL5_9PLEO|nr:aldose 1-epimerase [Decorospora gaudefroyi]
MRFSTILPLFAATALAQDSTSSLGPDDNGKYEISAEGIRAQFIPYGASITNLFVKGKDGVERDVILGFDNATAYEGDVHPHLGGVPGRYANRIKNSTFSIDGEEFHIVPNENNMNNTLHGGPDGWDYRNFTVVSQTESTITFSIVDPDGKEGFPGEVVSYVTYTMTPHTWNIKIVALATTKKTPIMLTSHAYWNLDGFANPDDQTALNWTFHLPYSGLRTGVDGILIPDGTLLPNEKYSVNDFWSSPKKIGANWTSPELEGNCGTNCTGYDNCYLVSRDAGELLDWRNSGPVASLSSEWSGIKLDIYSDQEAFQMYSCGFQDGTLPYKSTQGAPGGSGFVQQFGCVVMEVQDWIDAINNPEWMREKKQIYGPATPAFTLEAEYVFSTC